MKKYICISLPEYNPELLSLGQIYEEAAESTEAHYLIVLNGSRCVMLNKRYLLPLEEYRSRKLNKLLK
jgi:hypothetical protein